MRSRPKHQTRKMPSVVDAEGASAHLILNRAAAFPAALLESLPRAARERGIRVHVLEPGEDATLAALEAADDGAESLAVAGGDGSVAAVVGGCPLRMRIPRRFLASLR
jgi:diacylglycerol kinase family enzyme